jgi:hypothetical protein
MNIIMNMFVVDFLFYKKIGTGNQIKDKKCTLEPRCALTPDGRSGLG